MSDSSSTPRYSAAEAVKTQPEQAKKPTDIDRREPFTLDTCLDFLDATILTTPALLLIPALLYFWDRHQVVSGGANAGSAGSGGILGFLSSFTKAASSKAAAASYPEASYAHIKSLLFTKYKWIGRLVVFGLVKNLNHYMNRLCANNGSYKADKPDWSQEVVVVTGGAAGIGKAIVEVLSQKRKAKIAVLDLAPPTYAPAPRGAPAIQYYKTDVTNPAQVKAVAEQIRATLGEPTVLVNNAGIASGNTILESDPEHVQRVWRVNHLSNYVTLQEFLPYMVKHNHGHVVTVASSASFFSLPSMSEYSGSKSATLALHEVLRGELRQRYNAPRVRASLVAPTKVRTALGDGMEDHSLPFFHPVLEAYQLGRKVLWAVDSGLSQYMVLPRLMHPLPALRGFPDWLRRAFELIGNTDDMVSHKSISRALGNGYGANWQGEDKASREKVMARMQGNKK